MSRLVKTLLLAFAGVVLLVLLSAAALLLFFDPNDFRDDIAAQVETATGRQLEIEGDLSVSLFPWLAVEMGRTRLGNAEGFGDEPFASFESASLSVRLLPLILRREIAVGTAALDQMQLNLAVNADGVSNWDDLGSDESTPASDAEAGGSGPAGLDIASVEVSSATLRYRDAVAGSDYRIDNLSLTTGRVAFDEAFNLQAAFDFTLAPEGIDGRLDIAAIATVDEALSMLALDNLVLSGTVNGVAKDTAEVSIESETLRADLANSRLSPTVLRLQALGVDVAANIESASWGEQTSANAKIEVAPFSLQDLLSKLDVEPPATADPAALSRLSFNAALAYSGNALALDELEMQLDDTTLRGELAVPLAGNDPMRFDLAADRINLDRYMAPASDTDATANAAASDDFEIPVELIRSINAEGKLRLDEGMLSGMRFTNVELGLQSRDGKLRLNPLSAGLFDGSYEGDVRIDASTETPTLSLDERVSDVSLNPLAQSMFETDNISGTIDGSFVLNASGKTLSAMREKLNGTLSFELADGAWQGVDLWHQLRSARALYRREEPPAAVTPAQTEFSSVLVNGAVTDGVFSNKDLLVEMPFLQVTGNGTVNLVAGEVDYALQARVLERPEFLRGARDEELAEFTEALIPVRVRGPLTDPSVRPDIEAMFRKEVEDALEKKGDELRQRLLDRLSPDQEQSADGETADEDKDVEDQLKKRLKDLFEQ